MHQNQFRGIIKDLFIFTATNKYQNN